MEHRSLAPDLVVSNDDNSCGNQRTEEPATNVAQEELREEKQVGVPVNCSDSELCTFLQGLEAGFLPTYYSDTSQSVQSKSMSIASRSYQHGKKTVVFHGFPSLQMSRSLTADLGEELLMSYLAAFRAKTSAQPELARELRGGRSGLWREMARIIGEVRPSIVFVENSPLLVGRGLAIVLGDLASMGYDAEWFCLSASDCGAPHQRDRIWLVANASGGRRSGSNGGEMEQQRGAETVSASDAMADTFGNDRGCQVVGGETERENAERPADRSSGQSDGSRGEAMAHGHGHGHGQQRMVSESQPRKHGRPSGLHGGTRVFPAWPTDPADEAEPAVGRVVNGLAARVDRLKAIGNGQVPRVAATAFSMLSGK